MTYSNVSVTLSYDSPPFTCVFKTNLFLKVMGEYFGLHICLALEAQMGQDVLTV